MRASEFIFENSSKKGLRGGSRGNPENGFSSAHPAIIAPAGRGDLYIGRYYDFYRVASLTGMDPDELKDSDDIGFFGNLPVFSAYTEVEREKLERVLNKLKMDPKDWIPAGSKEPNDTQSKSPINGFKGYK